MTASWEAERSAVASEKQACADDAEEQAKYVAPLEQAKDAAPLRKVLFQLADRLDAALLVLGSVAVIVSGANQPLQLVVFGRILDSFNRVDKAEVKGLIHFFAAAYALLGVQLIITSALQIACFEAVASRRIRRLRERYLAALIRRPLSFFDTQDSGALAASVLDATSTVARGIGEELTMALQRLVAFLTGLALAFYYSWKFSLMVCAGLPLLAAVVGVANAAYARRGRSSDKALDSATSLAMESLAGLRAVAAFGREPCVLQRYKALLQTACREGIYLGGAKAATEAAASPVMFVMFGLGLWWGSKLVSDDMDANEACRYISITGTFQNPDPDRCITGGEIMTAFLSILFGFMGLLQALPGMAALTAARTSMAKVLRVVDAAPHSVDPLCTDSVNQGRVAEGRVELREVTFAYPARKDAIVFQGLSLTVEPGQTVALVGPSGCGKSTVVSLLERFYDPDSGCVLLDGVDVRSLPVRWLRAQIGLVSQEPVLFKGTIGENIALGKEGGASPQEVEAAARMANASDFVAQFSEGFATPVGEKGLQLSGGQKQRIAIARAVVRDPAVLVLDEATSALDTASERVVQAALEELLHTRRRTTLVIAHRLSTVRSADKIAVLAGGRLAEEGPHAELVRRTDGIYRNLVEAQAGTKGSEFEEVPDKLDLHGAAPSSLAAGQADDGPCVGDLPQPLARHEGVVTDVKNAAEGVPPTDMPAQDPSKMHAGREQAGHQRDGKPPETSVRWIWRLMLPEKWYFATGMFGAMVSGLTLPAIGFLMAGIIVVFFNKDVDEMRSDARTWALLFLAMGVVASAGAALRIFPFAVVTQRLALRVREAAFEALLRQNIGWFEVSPDRTVGGLVSRLSEDCTMLQALTGERASIAASQIVVLVVGLAVSFLASWHLTLLIFAIVPAIALPIALQVKMVAKYAEQASESTVNAGARAAEVVLNIRTVMALGLETHSMCEFSKELELPMRQGIRKGVAVGLGSGFAAGIILFGAAFKYFVGGIFFDMGVVTFPDIMRCVLVLIFMAFGIASVSKDATDKAEASMAAWRVHEIITASSAIDPMPAETKDTEAPPARAVQGRVELREVTFAYPARPQSTVLRGLSLTVEPGQTVALVGPSGCGKSTVVSLLERFYDPDSGRVLLDGADVRSLPVRWLRAQIGLVSQEPVLFRGTIGENIALGREGGASQQEVEAAARMANASDFVAQFPEGFATPVGEKGLQLSGGQKQRIAIARAVVRDPAVLVLDEATSALDAASERVVQAALEELLHTRRRTTLVIAHRLSTVEHADKIVVLSEGRLAEEGTHAELLGKAGGLYRSLARHNAAPWAAQDF